MNICAGTKSSILQTPPKQCSTKPLCVIHNIVFNHIAQSVVQALLEMLLLVLKFIHRVAPVAG